MSTTVAVVSDQTGQPEQTTEATRCCAGPVETGRWSRVECRVEYGRAVALVRHWHQLSLLAGYRWSGRNDPSRLAYLDQLTAAGVRARVEVQDHGRRVLVIECSGRCQSAEREG